MEPGEACELAVFDPKDHQHFRQRLPQEFAALRSGSVVVSGNAAIEALLCLVKLKRFDRRAWFR